MVEGPPNFHISYEKLKKIAEELRGGGDKDAEYWAWRKGGSDSSSEEDDFQSWLKQKRSGDDDRGGSDRRGDRKSSKQSRDGGRTSRNNEKSREKSRDKSRDKSREDSVEREKGPKHPTKRKQKQNDEEQNQDGYYTLWDPGEWEKGSRAKHHPRANKPSRTAKGGGVLKLPGKVQACEQRHSPVGNVRGNVGQTDGPTDFIYSDSGSDSDGYFTEDYPPTAVVNPQPSYTAVLNVVGIEKRLEKCASEAAQCSPTFCKESCSKFLGEGMRKKNSLEVLYESFDEHHTEIIHLRQELACVLSCAMMYDLESIQDQQTEASLWRNVFYQLIQYYRNKIVASNSDSSKTTLSQQLEDHIGEGIAFYNSLVKQIQRRYKVNYKHHTTGHNRTQVQAMLLLHKIFLWIGDLYRYLSQTRDTEEWGQARNYYLLAQSLAPRNPKPYHQLALLGKYAHRRLHAVYYFTLSLMVRNPFTQSKELLLSVLAELRRKAVLLERRDEDRSKRNNVTPGSKEVYSNKVIEWVFENTGDPSLNIPSPDIRKRFVVYLLSCLGGMLSNIDLARVEPEFQHFKKFYKHYVNLMYFEADEVYQQLFVVQLYALSNCAHRARSLTILECFLAPALDSSLVPESEAEMGDDWLCKLHSPLSVIFLLAQFQLDNTDVLEDLSVQFKKALVIWLNALQSAIQRYRKYTDFTEESVLLKEVTVLRGVEMLASLNNITKPYYLNSLTRGQSEDLGRAVLIVSTFEKLAVQLTFMSYTDKTFQYLEQEPVLQVEQEMGQSVLSENEEEEEGSSGSDVEIISQMTISDKTKEETVEENTDMTELKQKKEDLLKTLQENQDKKDLVDAAVKEIQGMRTVITVTPKTIVPDTNCFLDHLDKMSRLIRSTYRVLIPLVVLDEIAGLCLSKEKGERASSALDTLNKFIVSKAVSFITAKGSILDTKDFKEERRMSNDDMILSGVVALSHATGLTEERKGKLHLTRTVVFLTDDKNLRVKAHSKNIAVQQVQDFVLLAKL